MGPSEPVISICPESAQLRGPCERVGRVGPGRIVRVPAIATSKDPRTCVNIGRLRPCRAPLNCLEWYGA
jgi:hypothetical protein